MVDTATDRIEKIQKQLKQKGYAACIITSSDPHMSEYTARRWQSRAWASGFAGSAGTLVVGTEKAALWTDGRYFIEAESALKNTPVALMKSGLPETPEISQWLCQIIAVKGSKILVDAETCSHRDLLRVSADLAPAGLELIAGEDILEDIWLDRPGLPDEPIYEIDVEICGETRESKIARLREYLGKSGTQYILISALDQIAWLLNLRGSDVVFNPVFYAFVLVSAGRLVLYTHGSGMSEELREKLAVFGVQCSEYQKIYADLAALKGRLLADPANLNVAVVSRAGDALVLSPSPLVLWKAVKNSRERASLCGVMERDGVAMVRLLKWLESSYADGAELDELGISAAMDEFRSQQNGYMGNSFRSIAGFAWHGAIIHYSVDKTSNIPLDRDGLLLLDSGGQYCDGTSDITRTLPIGDIAHELKRQFTLVLKGNIALGRAVFPRGTTGLQLDSLARRALWESGLDYSHGTGHGVGFALNVHEGPQRISTHQPSVELLPGMICSNEPGYYQEGSHGIRIENLVAVEEHSDYPGFLRFETLTLCPIELSLVDKGMLDLSEITWLNAYHDEVWHRLAPLLEENERMWLQHKTRSI